MPINDLYQKALSGDQQAESELFRKLTEGFRIFVHQKVWNKNEIEDIVQSALATVAAEYKTIEIKTSFAAWAHKILKYRVMTYIQTRRRQGGRYVSIEDSDGYGRDWIPDISLRDKLLSCLKKIGSHNRNYARILGLTYQGFPVGEVCHKLSITPKQSYVVLSRARSMLRECLQKGKTGR